MTQVLTVEFDDSEGEIMDYGCVLEAIGMKLDEGQTSGVEDGCPWRLRTRTSADCRAGPAVAPAGKGSQVT